MSELDRKRIEELTEKLLLVIRENYIRGPVSPDRPLEALNALAASAALIIHGCDGPGGHAHLFFTDAFGNHLHSP